MRLKRNWFASVRREFCPLLLEYAGKPITYAEIGCWAGDSACWVADNVLTHAEAKGYGIDPYRRMRRRTRSDMRQLRDHAHSRMKHPNWVWMETTSERAFRRWRADIDVLYIDGEHEAPAALADFVRAWPYMRAGGLVIFDDHEIGQRKRFPHVPEAVAAVLTAFDGMVEVAQTPKRQVALRVLGKQTTLEALSERFNHQYNHRPALATIKRQRAAEIKRRHSHEITSESDQGTSEGTPDQV
jgi:predicted O-methyltransferase YrrM